MKESFNFTNATIAKNTAPRLYLIITFYLKDGYSFLRKAIFNQSLTLSERERLFSYYRKTLAPSGQLREEEK